MSTPMSRSAPEGEHHEFMAVEESLTQTLKLGGFGDRLPSEHIYHRIPLTGKIVIEFLNTPAMIGHGAVQPLNCCAIVSSNRPAAGQ